MFMKALQGTIDAAMSAAWKPVRSFYDGLSGTTHMNGASKAWRNADGEVTRRTPYGKLAQRLRADAMQTLTGRKYNPATGEVIDDGRSWLGRQTFGRMGGIAHGVGDLTLGTAATTIGWGARGAGALAAGASKPIARGIGHIAYQGARDTLGMAKDTTSLLYHMSRNPVGKDVLFGAGVIGVGGYAMADNMINEVSANRLSFYMNNQVDSLPGTLAAQGAAEGSQAMVSTGADGDLVFAMHNLR
jgi:hypothetical protein